MRVLITSLVVVAAVLSTAGLLFRSGADEVPPVLSIEQDGMVFSFHVLSGTESLFDVRADPRRLHNLTTERPECASAMRHELAERQGVADLQELCDHDDPLYRTLESHGYLK